MQSQSKTDTEAIQKVVEQLTNAWNRHSEKDFATLFTEDGEFTDVLGQLMKGRAEIERMHVSPFTTTLKAATLTIQYMRSKWVTPEIASVDLRWKTSGNQTPTGQPLPTRNGLMNLILIKKDNQLQIAVGHNFDYTATYKRADFVKD